MHTDEITYDAFIRRWFGRLGNNIQQLSNGIYFCKKENAHFTSPEHPMIKSIDLCFGATKYTIPETSHNWLFFFNGPEADFVFDVDDLNKNRKKICEDFILPNLKVDQTKIKEPLPDDHLIIHLRSGDLFTHWPSTHPQNPLVYYMSLLNLFEFNATVVSEDERHPFIEVFKKLRVPVEVLSVEDTYAKLLRAVSLATSGIGSFPVSAALCSKNIKRFYCTNLHQEYSLNHFMLKEHLEVYVMDLGDKYIKVGEWKYSPETFEKLYNYNEHTLFRRL